MGGCRRRTAPAVGPEACSEHEDFNQKISAPCACRQCPQNRASSRQRDNRRPLEAMSSQRFRNAHGSLPPRHKGQQWARKFKILPVPMRVAAAVALKGDGLAQPEVKKNIMSCTVFVGSPFSRAWPPTCGAKPCWEPRQTSFQNTE